MTFRPFDFSDKDYQAWLTIENTAHPEHPQSIEQAKHVDKTRGQEDIFGCFLVESDGQTIGWPQYETPRNPMPDMPETLKVHVQLLPDYQGFTHHLWEFLEKQLVNQKVQTLITRVYENWSEVVFYKSKGFVVYDSMWPSTLDLSTFDPKSFEHYIQKSKEAGIRLATLTDFPHQEATFRYKWYSLMAELLQGVPSTHPVAPWSYETWLERVPANPNLLPEGYFFALEDNILIGVSELWKSAEKSTLKTGLTAVQQSHRRKGIAQTLKLRAAQFAKDYGAGFINTYNHQSNQPMLAINETMGFIKEPALLFLKKDWI